MFPSVGRLITREATRPGEGSVWKPLSHAQFCCVPKAHLKSKVSIKKKWIEAPNGVPLCVSFPVHQTGYYFFDNFFPPFPCSLLLEPLLAGHYSSWHKPLNGISICHFFFPSHCLLGTLSQRTLQLYPLPLY